MEFEMTNEQFKTIINLIIEVIEKSQDKEEAIEKIKKIAL